MTVKVDERALDVAQQAFEDNLKQSPFYSVFEGYWMPVRPAIAAYLEAVAKE